MIDKWHGTFYQDFNIDDGAWKDLTSLALRSPSGYRKANGILHKMYERDMRWKDTHNPSAFVKGCVREALTDINRRSPHGSNRY